MHLKCIPILGLFVHNSNFQLYFNHILGILVFLKDTVTYLISYLSISV